jgi:hypothetical protein
MWSTDGELRFVLIAGTGWCHRVVLAVEPIVGTQHYDASPMEASLNMAMQHHTSYAERPPGRSSPRTNVHASIRPRVGAPFSTYVA